MLSELVAGKSHNYAKNTLNFDWNYRFTMCQTASASSSSSYWPCIWDFRLMANTGAISSIIYAVLNINLFEKLQWTWTNCT